MSGFHCLPFFLDSPEGPLFAVHHHPSEAVPRLGNVLCVPAFNEEMNRCRSMVTLQARELASRGWGTLVVDLHGTGDSAGDYGEARWSTWLDNLEAGRQWLQSRPGGCRALLGVRLGATLAAEFHARCADPGIALVLWQPVADGKSHLTQFLRVKVAAQMDRSDLPKQTTAGLRSEWAAGRSVEVAGYELHPELATAIDAARISRHRLPPGSRALWLEHAAADSQELSPGSRSVLEHWPGAEVRLTASTFAGPAFWQVYERALAPALVDIGTRWLTGLDP